MAYGRGVFRSLECLTCGAQFRRLLFSWSDPDDPRNELHQNLCPNLNCLNPHIRIRPSSNSTVMQVRASQRAVVYQFPDGTWSQPGTNDPNDPVAQECIRDGAVRREFYHTREMTDFQRSMRKSATDESSGYNDVIDMDESSRRDRGADTRDMQDLHRREDRLRTAFDHFQGRLGGERYEQLLKRLNR